MLNKLDLELFEILDSKVDKTLSEGCFFRIFDKIKMVFKVEKRNKQIGIREFEDYNVFMFEFANKITELVNIEDLSIWHYPTTNTVLRYIFKKYYIDFFDEKIISFKNEEWKIFNLDITREIQDYTNEQKQELINFLKNI